MNERDGFGAIKHVEDVLIDVRQEVERQPTGSDKPPLQITYVPRSVTGKSSDGAARIRLWDRAFELLLVMDASARIVDVSPAWASTLGWPIEHLIGRNFNELVHPVDIATLPTPWNERPEAIRAPSTLDRRLRCSVGGYRTISWVMFDNGDLIYAAGRDMGSGRQAVPIYETAPEQLSQSQKMETVGQLTSGGLTTSTICCNPSSRLSN